ncbi:MAG: hypothetical protein JWL94_416 [Microbacteriaceae bacterium]|jgi:hypothetical protein|nr:hypothetical protein [Microbacteriaceae bacterium]
MGQQADSDDAGEPQSPRQLGDRDVAILAFEHEWWRQDGIKDEAIRRNFGLSAARYYQLLNALIDTPAAIVHDPMLVRRLQRIRDARTSARATRIDQMTPAGRTRTND